MPKHEDKFCPRCQEPFECKVGSINLCQCTAVTLNDAERDYMRLQYSDCLCAACMQAVKNEYHNSQYQDTLHQVLKDR